MAPPSFSPEASISSHTLSTGSAPPTQPEMDLQQLLRDPAAFLQPVKASQNAVLASSKGFLDHVASAVSETQTQRQQELRRKRKRGADYGAELDVLNLKKLHLEGFSPFQVFEQSRKILESALEEVELQLPEPDTIRVDGQEGSDSEEGSGPEGDESDASIGEEGVDWEYAEDENEVYEGSSDEEGDEDVEMEDGEEMEDGDVIEDTEFHTEDESGEEEDEPAEEYVEDPHGLNDGFFSIGRYPTILF